MKLIAGSYERFLWGWRVEKKKQQLQPIFTYPAHLGPIKCMAAMGPVLATGSSDDTIKVFDLEAQRDMGTLIMHQGAVTCLSFYAPPSTLLYPNNLLSGSEDGTVCIWDTSSWQHFKTMKGHKKGVNDLTIHPSGRLALSVGRDSHLNMYDLLKGRCTFTNRLQIEGSLIRFCPETGDMYCVASQEVVTVYNSEDGCSLHSFSHDKRVLCMAQNEDNLLLTGGEDCSIGAWDTRTGKLAFSVSSAHQTRIRGVVVMSSEHSLSSGDAPFLFASASSDGFVRVWDARMAIKIVNEKLTPIMQTETNARLTCLVASSLKRTIDKSKAGKAPLQHCGFPIEEKSELRGDEISPSELKESAANQLVIESPTFTSQNETEKIKREKKKRKKKMGSTAQGDMKKSMPSKVK